jgi:FlaA1/EpsC-like NDP-sugar epimerase
MIDVRMASAGTRILKRLAGWPRGRKQLLIATTDAILLSFSIWAAFALRMGQLWPDGMDALLWLPPAAAIVGIPTLWACGLYREVTRHAGGRSLWQATQGVGITALAVAALLLLSGDWAPRSLPIIFFLVALGLVNGSRSIARYLLLRADIGIRAPSIVWGAGDAGVQLAGSLLASAEYRPVAILDDDPRHRATRIRGVPILPTSELERLVERGAKHVFLAAPELGRAERRAVLERVTRLPVLVRSVPSLADVVAGRASWDELREIPVEELLGREPVPPDGELLARFVRGRSVLVTGAGGSIGSEICRQALAFGARKLVLFERSEHALYLIEQELRSALGAADREIVGLLGSVLDRERLERALRFHRVETLYHAAAYKHVPIVERNVAEGIENNALGTLVAAEAALAADVERFVLISTDKAVRPTSVMGASKRLAELILQALAADRLGRTVFSIVRFGNVLGSSGSVVPLFRAQIAAGGPVTVTHPDVIRYFMTIPEAAQLVMQAGAMATGGEVFLLDMGEPVRIAELARRMIRLAGRSVREVDEEPAAPDSIAIRYTGLRPGEKLFEELLIAADAMPTGHPRIRTARESSLPSSTLRPLLDRLAEACRANDAALMRRLLAQAVVEYRAEDRHHDLLWDDEDKAATAATAILG